MLTILQSLDFDASSSQNNSSGFNNKALRVP